MLLRVRPRLTAMMAATVLLIGVTATPALASDEPSPGSVLDEAYQAQQRDGEFGVEHHGWCNSLRVFGEGSGHVTYRPAINGGTTHCIVGYGAGPWNHGVVALQMSLFLCYGQDTGGYDGHYLSMTEAAVVHVQEKYGLTVDGVYGPQTGRAMEWVWFRESDGQPHDCERDIWV